MEHGEKSNPGLSVMEEERGWGKDVSWAQHQTHTEGQMNSPQDSYRLSSAAVDPAVKTAPRNSPALPRSTWTHADEEDFHGFTTRLVFVSFLLNLATFRTWEREIEREISWKKIFFQLWIYFLNFLDSMENGQRVTS